MRTKPSLYAKAKSQRKLIKVIAAFNKRVDIFVAKHTPAIDLDRADMEYEQMRDNGLSFKDIADGEVPNPYDDMRSAYYG